MEDHLRLRCSQAARLGLRFASLDKTQEQLYSKPPHFQILLKAPLKMGPRRLPARPRDRRPGSSRYNCVLCSIRRLHCHTDSAAVPSGRAIPHGAAIGAPACRHPARQLRRSAGLVIGSGLGLGNYLARCARKTAGVLFKSFFPDLGVSCLSPSLRRHNTSLPARGALRGFLPRGKAGGSAF